LDEHDKLTSPRQRDEMGDVHNAALQERGIRCLDRHVCATAHGGSDIGVANAGASVMPSPPILGEKARNSPRTC